MIALHQKEAANHLARRFFFNFYGLVLRHGWVDFVGPGQNAARKVRHIGEPCLF
jgi:hypothetical protein